MCSCWCHSSAQNWKCQCSCTTPLDEFPVGAKLRLTWPDGSIVQGTVELGGRLLYGAGKSTGIKYSLNDGAVPKIISVPRPNEPMGLGAVVHAELTEGGIVWTFVRTPRTDRPWVVGDGGCFDWSSMINPKISDHGYPCIP